MNEKLFFKTRVVFTALVTLAMWMLLLWEYYHGGVPAHHILHREDMPAISNWWGGLLLPLLTWFLMYLIQRRIVNHNNENPDSKKFAIHIVAGFISALLFGILLSVFFTFNYATISSYMVIGLFVVGVFLPIYRSEYLLGFVIGMTFTFGAALPIAFGAVIVLISVVLYKYVRPILLHITSKILHTGHSNK